MPLALTTDVLGFLRRWAAGGFDRDADYLPIFADALEEAGYANEQNLRPMRAGSGWLDVDDIVNAFVPADLSEYDWRHAFAYAGEPKTGYVDGEASLTAAPPTADVPLNPFARWDVAEVYGTSAGENDGPNWLAYGRLHDGRHFFLTAGCDLTGWG